MNLKILLLAISAAGISSCSTMYKSGQTPDDVYYSPGRAVADNNEQENKETPGIMRNGYADRQIVMSIYDPRWRYFDDDYGVEYDPYHYGYNCGYYYNPYYYPSPVYISGAEFINPKNTTPRMTNLGSYFYSSMIVVNPKAGATALVRSSRPYNNSNSETNYIRRIIIPTNNNSQYNNTYQPSNSTRTYTPSSSSSGSSSGSSSSGAPVSRPHRGG